MNARSFIAHQHDELCDVAQGWLDQHQTFNVTHMAVSSNNYGHCVTLVGKEETTAHRYRFTLVYGMDRAGYHRGDDMEAGINAALQGPGELKLLAQSGNELGYLCALLFRL